MYNMQYVLLSFPCFLVHVLPHFVAQIVTCFISYGLWPHAVGLNEQNKYHISYHYINDLPMIINKTSAPIIFADNTSILFAHSNRF
jgi:hypothetical protein